MRMFKIVSGMPVPVAGNVDGAVSLERAAAETGRSASDLNAVWEAAWGAYLEKASEEAGVDGSGGIVEAEGDPMRLDVLREYKYRHFNDAQWKVFVEACRSRKLNPWWNQICAVLVPGDERENEEDAEVQIIVQIMGMRAIAHRTGEHGGIDAAEIELDDAGELVAASITVYRSVNGERRPSRFRARFDEYVGDSRFWRQMPQMMLGKCAEAGALRMAFPEYLGGVYTPEEVGPRRAVRQAPSGRRVVRDEEGPTTEAELVEALRDLGLDRVDRVRALAKARRALGHLKNTPEFYRAAWSRIRSAFVSA